MKALKIINQFYNGEVTMGTINQRENLSEEKTVQYWVFKCQKAGIAISHVCYGINKVFSNWHYKTPLKIDLERY